MPIAVVYAPYWQIYQNTPCSQVADLL